MRLSSLESISSPIWVTGLKVTVCDQRSDGVANRRLPSRPNRPFGDYVNLQCLRVATVRAERQYFGRLHNELRSEGADYTGCPKLCCDTSGDSRRKLQWRQPPNLR